MEDTRFGVWINTSGAAFPSGRKSSEKARLLREVADKVESGVADGWIRDTNGNTVGQFGNFVKGGLSI